MAADEEQSGDDDGAEGSRFLQEERAHRLAKLDAMRERGVEPYPVRFDRDHTAAELHDRFDDLGAGRRRRRASCESPGASSLLRRHGRLDFVDLRDETGTIQLFVPASELGEDALDDLRRARPRRLGRRRRAPCDHPASGELSVKVDGFELLVEGAAPAARQVARPHRRRDPLPPALRRPHRQRRARADLRDPLDRDRRDPRRARSSAASSRSRRRCCSRCRRRDGAPVHHAPQRARHRPVPAHRARAAPQAADRRRLRAGLRDRPHLPQRGLSTPATTPSSRCSRSTRRSATTTT